MLNINFAYSTLINNTFDCVNCIVVGLYRITVSHADDVKLINRTNKVERCYQELFEISVTINHVDSSNSVTLSKKCWYQSSGKDKSASSVVFTNLFTIVKIRTKTIVFDQFQWPDDDTVRITRKRTIAFLTQRYAVTLLWMFVVRSRQNSKETKCLPQEHNAAYLCNRARLVSNLLILECSS